MPTSVALGLNFVDLFVFSVGVDSTRLTVIVSFKRQLRVILQKSEGRGRGSKMVWAPTGSVPSVIQL